MWLAGVESLGGGTVGWVSVQTGRECFFMSKITAKVEYDGSVKLLEHKEKNISLQVYDKSQEAKMA